MIRVQLLPTSTGTLQLRILLGSVIESLAGLELDTTGNIDHDTVITILAGATPDDGLRYWDGAITSGGTDGVSQGGNGTWNTTITNWDKGAGFAGPVAWDNTGFDTAILGGSAGTITLGEGVTAAGINSSSTYTISGAHTLTMDVSSGTPVINVAAGQLTINSQISGNDGLQKDGGGTLRLGNNSNDFSGGLVLNDGDLFVETGGVYGGWGSGDLTINGGRIRTNSSGTFTTENDSIWNANFGVFRGTTGRANWVHDGDITLGGNVTVNSPNNYWQTTVNGNIGEVGGARSLSFTGAGQGLILNGLNTFSGGLTWASSGVDGATILALHINNGGDGTGSSIGTGTLTISGDRSIDNSSGNAVTVSTNNSQEWQGNFTFVGSNPLNLGNGAVTMNANRTVTVTASTLTVGGAVGQSGGNRTLNKAGNGTLVLSGANTYAGNTTVSAGTLALVGGSQNSAITVNSGASLGFTLGSPTTSSKALTLSGGHSIAITGTVNNVSDYQLMTATSITGTPTLAAAITDYELELREGNTELWLTFTGTISASPYDTWAATFLPDDVSDPTGDFDSDGISNLLEFAFGTDPTVDDAGALSWDGMGDAVPGSPAVHIEFPAGGGVNFTARFMRRKDHGDSGSVDYFWRFSSDLSDWESSASDPAPGWFEAATVLAEDASGDYELVEVPYPFFLDANGKKARFFQVGVSLVP